MSDPVVSKALDELEQTGAQMIAVRGYDLGICERVKAIREALQSQQGRGEAISAIIRSVVARDPTYWLDGDYIRWGKVERDLIEAAGASQQTESVQQKEGE